ncbi:hypothetical protein TrST_g12404 [Triparma strigata]|uniref:Uncharacterized protein n=1 Tax=Triparma strigata TaxID=1606541 RepID=A0A9W7ADU4_9STRA|nr:hypothetical protein TrST_g12404 [Triparma strigata]
MSHSTLMSKYRSSKTSSSAAATVSAERRQTFLLLTTTSTDSYSFSPGGGDGSGGGGQAVVTKGPTFMKSSSSSFNHNNNVLTLHPDTTSASTTSPPSELYLHHATGPHLETLPLPAPPLSSQFGLKSRYLLTTGSATTTVYDLKKKSTVRTFVPPSGQAYLESKFNFGQNLVLGLTPKSLLIYTLKDAKCVSTFQSNSNDVIFKNVQVNNFQEQYTVCTSQETILTDGNKELYKLPNSTCASHSKVNRLLLSTCKSSLATFYDTNTFRIIKSLSTGISDILDCGFSHDGVHFVCTGDGGSEIWDLRNVERPVWKGEGGRKVVWESKRKESKGDTGEGGASVASVASVASSIKSLRSPGRSPGRNSVKSSFRKDDSISGRIDVSLSEAGEEGGSSVDEMESVKSKTTTAASSVVGSVEESLRRLKGEGGLAGIDSVGDAAGAGGRYAVVGGDTVVTGVSEVTGASRSTVDSGYENVKEITPRVRVEEETVEQAPSTPLRMPPETKSKGEGSLWEQPPPAPEVPDSPLPPSPIRRVESPSPARSVRVGAGMGSPVPTPAGVRRDGPEGGLNMEDLTSPGGLNMPTLNGVGGGGEAVGAGGAGLGISPEHKLVLDNLPQNIADLQGMVTGLHVEMLRQFQYMQDDNDSKLDAVRRDLKDIVEENRVLRLENEKLRGVQ